MDFESIVNYERSFNLTSYVSVFTELHVIGVFSHEHLTLSPSEYDPLRKGLTKTSTKELIDDIDRSKPSKHSYLPKVCCKDVCED